MSIHNHKIYGENPSSEIQLFHKNSLNGHLLYNNKCCQMHNALKYVICYFMLNISILNSIHLTRPSPYISELI